MKLSELMKILEELSQQADSDPEVRLATQPQWPFELSIGEVAMVDLNRETREELTAMLSDAEIREDVQSQLDELGDSSVVYIAEKSQIGYLPGEASAVVWG